MKQPLLYLALIFFTLLFVVIPFTQAPSSQTITVYTGQTTQVVGEYASTSDQPSFPSDKWERIWYNYSKGELWGYFGVGSHQSNLEFDDNWGQGVVAYNKNDFIGFVSSRTLYLEAGQYTFIVCSDDGAMLYIDGKLVIDAWRDQICPNIDESPNRYTASFTKPGNYKFRLDWYENQGYARIAFKMIRQVTLLKFQQDGLGSDALGTVLIVDSVGYTYDQLPITFKWAYGSSHLFTWLSPISVSSGKRYTWASTSGLSTAQSGTINATSTGSITGNYQTQYLLTIQVSPQGTGTTNPVPGSYWYNSGDNVSIAAKSLSTSYKFHSWSGDIIGTSNPTSITMNGSKSVTANFVPIEITITHTITATITMTSIRTTTENITRTVTQPVTVISTVTTTQLVAQTAQIQTTEFALGFSIAITVAATLVAVMLRRKYG